MFNRFALARLCKAGLNFLVFAHFMGAGSVSAEFKTPNYLEEIRLVFKSTVENPSAVLMTPDEMNYRSQLLRDSRMNSKTKYLSLCSKYALDYIGGLRVQEAIWLLTDCHNKPASDLLYGLLENHLLTAPLKETRKIGDGLNGSSFGFAGNIPVVIKDSKNVATRFKFYASRFQRYGYAASVLAQTLEFTISPTLAVRTKKGGTLSVQIALQNAKNSGINFKKNAEFYGVFSEELFILDFLTQNLDRHQGNSMWDARGELIAIDNESWVMTPFSLNRVSRTDSFGVTEETYEKIHNIQKSDFYDRMKDSLTPFEFSILWNRLLTLRNILYVKNEKGPQKIEEFNGRCPSSFE